MGEQESRRDEEEGEDRKKKRRRWPLRMNNRVLPAPAGGDTMMPAVAVLVESYMGQAGVCPRFEMRLMRRML